jgi:hypothetical protein
MGDIIMICRNRFLSATIGLTALGALALPAYAEDGRNAAAAVGAAAGFAAGAAAAQGGYYRPVGPRYVYRDDEGWGYRRWDREHRWHMHRWCYYHPGRC